MRSPTKTYLHRKVGDTTILLPQMKQRFAGDRFKGSRKNGSLPEQFGMEKPRYLATQPFVPQVNGYSHPSNESTRLPQRSGNEESAHR